MDATLICYGQTMGWDWVSEWYETSAGTAARRARELRGAGWRVAVDGMGSQVTPVGLVRMTLLSAFGDGTLELPPVRVETMEAGR